MRSSIACTKCRRSKVRCNNNGVHTTCEACKKNGRICEYPSGAGEPSQRRGSIAAHQDASGDRLNGEVPPKKKKLAPSSSARDHLKDKPATPEDALDPQLFTPQIWTQLFSIFEQHFATDLPFLHAPTFLEKLRQVDLSSPLDNSFAALLLAFLTLTAPFHDALVQHSWRGSGRPKTPIEVSKRYADAARARLDDSTLSKPTLESTQALLMLGLHEWGLWQGAKAFLTIGTAIRCAQQLGCQYQDDLDDMQASCVETLDAGDSEQLSREERFIRDEIKRRTFWSCFIMDRYLGSGKYRPRMVHVGDLRIQLPCSERAFNFGLNVKTRKLRETDEEFCKRREKYSQSKRLRSPVLENGNGIRFGNTSVHNDDADVKWEDESDQETLSWFIKALDICGDTMQWGCTVTRRNEEFAPWDTSSSFYKFETRLNDLIRHLPVDLTLSPSRTNVHISSRTARSYVLLHSAITLCTIALHREYLQFLPFGCSKPEGPKDGPLPPGRPDEGNKYWEDRAEIFFKAVRDFLDMMSLCRQRGVLVETPLTGFCVYQVVFVVLWCAFFPKMDQHNYLCTKGTRNDQLLGDNWERAWGMLDHMRDRLQMARGWCKTIHRLLEFLKNAKRDYSAWVGSPNTSSSIGSGRSLKDGLTEYMPFEKDLKEFGNHQKDVDSETGDGEKISIDLRPHLDEASECGSPHAFKSEDGETIEGTPESASQAPGFTAVNGNGSMKASSDIGTPKPTISHSGAYGPGTHAPTQVLLHGSYRPSFTSPSGEGPHYLPMGYQPTAAESAQRATAHLNHHIQDQPMEDASLTAYPQMRGQERFEASYGYVFDNMDIAHWTGASVSLREGIPGVRAQPQSFMYAVQEGPHSLPYYQGDTGQ